MRASLGRARLVGAAALAVLFVHTPVHAMTVEQAYASLAHQHLVFDPRITTMPEDEATYLKELFAIIDAVVVERVETMEALQQQTEVLDHHDQLLSRLYYLRVPKPAGTGASVGDASDQRTTGRVAGMAASANG